MWRAVFVIVAALAGASPVWAQQMPVVASFSILADFTRQVGGERVAVSSLVAPGGDAHVYTPTPADAKTIAGANLVIVNGLGFEGWMQRLVRSSGGKAPVVTVTKGIKPREMAGGHGHGHDADPHAWQSVVNAKIYVVNIRDALIAADAAGAEVYRANAAAYLEKLDALDREIREAIGKLPEGGRKVISTHDAFGYLAANYGISFIAAQGISTESEVTAGNVAALIRQIRREKIPAVFLENVADPRLMQRIAAETGARIGGTLYSDSLTAENGDAPTYIDMVRHNIKTLTAALAR